MKELFSVWLFMSDQFWKLAKQRAKKVPGRRLAIRSSSLPETLAARWRNGACGGGGVLAKCVFPQFAACGRPERCSLPNHNNGFSLLAIHGPSEMSAQKLPRERETIAKQSQVCNRSLSLSFSLRPFPSNLMGPPFLSPPPPPPPHRSPRNTPLVLQSASGSTACSSKRQN